jgi:Prenyltransferase and squalene oxidase repeat
MDAAIGYVVAHGDPVERARLSYLRTRAAPSPEVIERITAGQTPSGGWPASGDSPVPSVDATCFRLGELDDLGGLHGPHVDRALDWLASVQRDDGTWQEDEALAAEAPPWALPGDAEATLYLTSVAGFWLTVAEVEAHPYHDEPGRHQAVLARAAAYVVAQLRPDGTWPSFLAAGWHAAGLLHEQQYFYESARMQLVLGDRLDGMSPADVASMAAALRRVNLGDDWLLRAARKRLGETQRTDGGWDSDEGPLFDVNTTLIAIRAVFDRPGSARTGMPPLGGR